MIPLLRRYIPRAHAALAARSRRGLPLRDMSIALVNDARMAELHQEFMSIPGPTDVLTFPLDHDARGRVTSGEVVICVPYARRIAKERKIPADREVLLYAIHGMLHLLGYDDRNPAAYRTMHRTEDELLTKLGIGPLFDPQRGGRMHR
jgi:probable rRNA maturation factor